MLEPRRFDDDQVREILRRASEADASRGMAPSERESHEGLTLEEIQEIGAEVGLDRALVARAAADIGRPSPESSEPPRTILGVPVSVGHTAELPGSLSDAEWDLLVVRLRETFRAKGRVGREGALRSWSNGNLHVLHEPTATGYRLRMGSVSSAVQRRVTMGVALAGAGAAFATVAALKGDPGGVTAMLVLLGGGGMALYLSGRAKASRWIARRKDQFLEIGGWASARLGPGEGGGLLPGGKAPPSLE